MFTGLTEGLGTIKSVRQGSGSLLIELQPEIRDFTPTTGDSVCVSGVCLTVEESLKESLLLRAGAETLKKTVLSNLSRGDKVNIERSMRPNDRLEGHIVQGHVSCTGRITRDRPAGDSIYRTITIPETEMKYMAEKGSVAVDGISLTLTETGPSSITVSLIPHTIKNTTMGLKKNGSRVNIESDLFARYIFKGLLFMEDQKDKTELYRKLRTDSFDEF
ncbi:MAG: riboflavin synthase [Chitinivibrionales bacterium]